MHNLGGCGTWLCLCMCVVVYVINWLCTCVYLTEVDISMCSVYYEASVVLFLTWSWLILNPGLLDFGRGCGQ